MCSLPVACGCMFVVKIEEFLTAQLNEDAEMASALLIHTVNKDQEKVTPTFNILHRFGMCY